MNDAPDDSDDPSTITPSRSLPSGWLAFYSLVFLGGSAYLTYVAFAADTLYRLATVLAAIYCGIVGVMLWIRARFALQAYLFAGIGALCWAGYRLWSAGYTTSRVGLIVGGVMILLGGWSVAEELE